MTCSVGDAPRPHVLIVDDEETVRDVLREVCEELGWSTAVAGDRGDALLAVCQRRPDLVFLDSNFDHADGISAIRDLHLVRPGLPVVVITVDDPDDIADAIARAGGTGVITKQCSVAQVAAVLERYRPSPATGQASRAAARRQLSRADSPRAS